jgi:hypothetical protein
VHSQTPAFVALEPTHVLFALLPVEEQSQRSPEPSPAGNAELFSALHGSLTMPFAPYCEQGFFGLQTLFPLSQYSSSLQQLTGLPVQVLTASQLAPVHCAFSLQQKPGGVPAISAQVSVESLHSHLRKPLLPAEKCGELLQGAPLSPVV